MRRKMRTIPTIVAAAALSLAASIPRFSSGDFTSGSSGPGSSPGARSPERPRQSVDTGEAFQRQRTIRVPAHGDLQEALDAASPGDLIALEEGATYAGSFRLPRKQGSGWIVIIGTSSDARLPPPGQRVNPSYAPAMPKLVASSGSVIVTEPAAHHYRFVGIEFGPAHGTFLHDLVQLGLNHSDVDDVPHHIIFDRCYLHGDPQKGTRRGIAMNSRSTAVVDSYLSDFKEAGADSQAIAGWNGPGPFKIANSFLEAAGENVLFGGADPSIPDLVPADIEIRGNHLAKPLRWRAGSPDFEATQWSVKNLFELKNARRVIVEGNVFEYNWPQSQNGFAILFTVRNQDGAAPWSVVEDVIFANNVVRHVAAGINVLGRDDIHPSRRTARIAIRNNLFLDVGGRWGGGRLFQLLDGTADISIDRNTAVQSDMLLSGGDHAPHTGFVFQDNIVVHNRLSIIGSGTAPGRPSLDRYFPGALVRRNLIVGGRPEQYPSGNFFPASVEQVGFVSPQDGNYRLAASSSYRHAGPDGREPGADLDAIAKFDAVPESKTR
jgi:hypothetical protein